MSLRAFGSIITRKTTFWISIRSILINLNRIQVLWVFQYFGDKFNISGEEAIGGYLDYLGKLFDLSAICDPSNEAARNVIFTQDIALTIS